MSNKYNKFHQKYYRNPENSVSLMDESFVVKMKHVQIRWKAVCIVAIITVTIIALLYRMSATGSKCSSDSVHFEQYKSLDEYCNYPYSPVIGLEGSLLLPHSHLKLVSVHVVIRHGDRSPLHTMPGVDNEQFRCREDPASVAEHVNLTDFLKIMGQRGDRKSNLEYSGYKLYPSEAACEMGSLTPAGVKQHILNGRFLRNAYLKKHRLLKYSNDGPTAEQQILIRGTTIGRTFQSAVAFMYGFEPRLDMSSFPSIEMADNNTMCMKQSGHKCSCVGILPRYVDSFAPSFGQFDPVISKLPATSRIAARLGISVPDLPKLSHVFDVAMTHYCHEMMPGCFGTDLARDVFDLIQESGSRAIADRRYKRLARLKSQPLLFEIAQRMKSHVQTLEAASPDIKPPPTFVLYSGHDSTIEPLAAAIGVGDGSWPLYASRLIFELYHGSIDKTRPDTREAYIRVLHGGKDVTGSLSFCKGKIVEHDGGLCRLGLYTEFAEDGEFNGGNGQTGYINACENGVGIVS